MSSSYMTIQSFAMEIQMSVEYLIQQFLNIGITKTKFDFVTKLEKDMLLKHMHYNKLAISNKFELKRKTRSTLSISSISGKNKQIQVEVRKKRIYMVTCSTKNVDSCNGIQNKLQNKNLLNINDESINSIRNGSSTRMHNNNINVDDVVLLKKTLKQVDQSKPGVVKIQDQLNIKNSYKKDPMSQNFDHKEQKLNDYKYVSSKLDVKTEGQLHHNQSNSVNILNNISNTKVKNSDYKLENERRYNTHTRLKYKVTGKLVRQKRNNNHRTYIESMHDELNSESEVCSTVSRINKNRRKQSTLVHSFNKPIQTIARNIVIGETISVLELSNKMSVKSSYLIKIMLKLGLMVTVNQIIDQETAQLVIEEMGHNVILSRKNELEFLIMKDYHHDNADEVICHTTNKHNVYTKRTPIVAIMGHVDHGKTSLLDCICSMNMVNYEYGGITQSIRSYRAKTKSGDTITFLDTPGHEAFAKMRLRGAQLTDIIVLVIAADDGVMPQTIEAIQHIKSINIPVIVAINKIDKLDINIDLIKHALNKYGLVPEEWGGSTQFVNVSARSGVGIDELLDAILLQSEVLELKTIHYGIAKAVVIESSLDKERGPVITVLIREGELKCGDIILCGTEYGRVKAMRDEFRNDILKAGPSIPVELLGLSGVPDAGETMVVVRNEKQAKAVALYRQSKRREIKLARKQEEYPLNHVFNDMSNTIKIPELNFIVKSNNQGSVEAICESLKKLSTDKIVIKIIFSSIGNITETDAVLASTSNAAILAFNVKAESVASRILESSKVEVYCCSIIYDLLNSVNRMINSVLIPKIMYKTVGIAEVRNVFSSLKFGTIAGCMVTEGIIKSHKKIKIVRNSIMIHEGELESLRHFKNDVNEVKTGMECGITVKNYHDLRFGDIIQVLDKSDVSPC